MKLILTPDELRKAILDYAETQGYGNYTELPEEAFTFHSENIDLTFDVAVSVDLDKRGGAKTVDPPTPDPVLSLDNFVKSGEAIPKVQVESKCADATVKPPDDIRTFARPRMVQARQFDGDGDLTTDEESIPFDRLIDAVRGIDPGYYKLGDTVIIPRNEWSATRYAVLLTPELAGWVNLVLWHQKQARLAEDTKVEGKQKGKV